MMRFLERIAVVCLLVGVVTTFSGCATLADARMAKGSGIAKEYNISTDMAWKDMRDIIKDAGLEYVGENREEGYMLAQRGITVMSYGEEVAIFISPVAQNMTRIEIVSKKALATNVFAPDWANRLFMVLDKRYSKN